MLAVLAAKGRWHAEEEWRIVTWFSTTSERLRIADRDWYKATVERDGQQFSCRCPSVEKPTTMHASINASCWNSSTPWSALGLNFTLRLMLPAIRTMKG